MQDTTTADDSARRRIDRETRTRRGLLASIERVNDDLQEKVDQFEEREEALREWFQDAMA